MHPVFFTGCVERFFDDFGIQCGGAQFFVVVSWAVMLGKGCGCGDMFCTIGLFWSDIVCKKVKIRVFLSVGKFHDQTFNHDRTNQNITGQSSRSMVVGEKSLIEFNKKLFVAVFFVGIRADVCCACWCELHARFSL